MFVSKVERRHSPVSFTCHAVVGSRPVALTMGLMAPVMAASFVQFVCSWSLGSAGLAMHRFVPPGQLSTPGLHSPG